MDRKLLDDLAKYVLLKSGMVSDPGLAHGKMGMVLFLMHYARYTGIEPYEEYAGLLLDDIYSNLDMNLPVNLESGLCGVGWGTEYLLQNQFAEGDGDEILTEIDRKIMERDPLRLTDWSMETGLTGIIEYALIRLRAGKKGRQEKLFDREYWAALREAAGRVSGNTNNEVYRKRAEILLFGIEHPEVIPERQIFDVVRFFTPLQENLWQRPDGLSDGNAGAGLQMILR